VVVFLWEILLVISEESVQLDALFEVLRRFQAPDVFKEVEIAIRVNTGANHAVPVDALQLDVGVVLLEVEIESATEIDIGTLDGVHVLSSHFELIEVEILWKYFHPELINN